MVWWGEFAETVGSAWTYFLKPGLIVYFEAHFWCGTYRGFGQIDGILFSNVSKYTDTHIKYSYSFNIFCLKK